MFAATDRGVRPGAAGRGRARRRSRPPTRPAWSPTARSRRTSSGWRSPTRKGIRSSQERTWAQFITVSMGPDGGTGYAEAAAVDVTTIDAAALGREAAAKARATGAAQPHRARRLPGRARGVRGRRHPRHARLPRVQRARGPGGALVRGARQARRRRRSSRSATTARTRPGLPMAFDYEGVPKQRVAARRARASAPGVVYDSQTAARGGRPLDRPRPARPEPVRAVPAEHGDGRPATTSREELIGGLDRGLLVTRFHYTNPVHPKLAIITGMTRDGTFLVEGGKIVGPGPQPALHAELPRRRSPAVERRRPGAARRSRASSAASRRAGASASTPGRSRAPPSTDRPGARSLDDPASDLAWPASPEVHRRIRRLWQRHSIAEDRRDIDGLIATLTPDCVYELVPTGQRWEGHVGAREFYTDRCSRRSRTTGST